MGKFDTKLKNDKIFQDNLKIIEELSKNNFIPAEIAKAINMERHALLKRLRKKGFKINNKKTFSEDKKICYLCKNEKDLSEFAKKSTTLNTFSSRCKECRKIGLMANRVSYIYSQIKNNAKQRNLEFNLTKDDIVIPEYCPILKVKLDVNTMSTKNRYAPSVDRIDSKKGYIKGNIMVISIKANMMKNDATDEELLNFSEYFINLKNK